MCWVSETFPLCKGWGSKIFVQLLEGGVTEAQDPGK